MNKTSTHIGGFWFHIEWHGDIGKDHRGNYWKNKENPEPENKMIKPLCEAFHEFAMAVLKA